VNPLRGQNNVRGSCGMGSFPHEFPGYRHVSEDAARSSFEEAWGVTLDEEPGLQIPNMFDCAVEGSFKGIYVQREDILQSDPDRCTPRSQTASHRALSIQLFIIQPRIPQTPWSKRSKPNGSSWSGSWRHHPRRLSAAGHIKKNLSGRFAIGQSKEGPAAIEQIVQRRAQNGTVWG
jgi:hypothetical protein